MNHSERLKVLLITGSTVFKSETCLMLQRIRPCEIEHKDSVHKSLRYFIQYKPDLVIADWQLESHTASDLLQAMRTNDDWKRIPVVIIIDESDRDLTEQALTLGAAQVLLKPLNQNALSRILAGFFPVSRRQVKGNTPFDYREIKAKLEQIHLLAPLPSLAAKIMDLLKDPNSSARDLAGEIKKDQSITARILKIANSAYYGFHREIGNVDRAIVVLGFDEIMNIAQVVCLMEAFDTEDDSALNRKEFWGHSLGTAHIARALSKRLNDLSPRDAFVMGLLHDFGKVVLNQHFREEFHYMIKTAEDQQRPLHEVCRELTGTDHAEIGGMVAESWKLPLPLVRAIRYHHRPESVDKDGREIDVAHLANFFCHRYKIGESGNSVADEPNYLSLLRLGIKEDQLDEFWQSLKMDPMHLRDILE